MKDLVILGSTGSIGESALRVVAALPGQLRVTGLAARCQTGRLVEQARQFGVRRVALADRAAAAEARRLAPELDVLEGEPGVEALAREAEADVALCALVGLSGLRPVLAAMASGKDVALATKEVLVAAGEWVMRRRAECGVRLLPVDSEHSALFQCLQSGCYEAACVRSAETAPSRFAETRVRRLVLTASGGPFAATPEVDFSQVTVADALNHPRWRMGRKVTIDSATMMNKGLEILEARWLYTIPVEHIEVLIHPQSVVHSLVEFCDRSVLAQLSPPDMRFAIQYALTWPDREAAELPELDLTAYAGLTFSHPDERRFRCLALARAAARQGMTYPVVLNGANEEAVEAFLGGRIPFSGIGETVDTVLGQHSAVACTSLETVEAADAWARRAAAAVIAKKR